MPEPISEEQLATRDACVRLLLTNVRQAQSTLRALGDDGLGDPELTAYAARAFRVIAEGLEKPEDEKENPAMSMSTSEFAVMVAQAIHEKMLRNRENPLYRGAYAQVVNKGVDGSDRVDCVETQFSDLSRFCLYLEVRSVNRESIGKTEADPTLFDNPPRISRKADDEANGPKPPTPLFDTPEASKKARRRSKATTTVPPDDDPAAGLGDDEVAEGDA